jgi:hypothetical protein
MNWFYGYLGIGALVAFVSCFTPPAQKASVFEFVFVVLIFILFWPTCLFGSYLKRLTKDADGNER